MIYLTLNGQILKAIPYHQILQQLWVQILNNFNGTLLGILSWRARK